MYIEKAMDKNKVEKDFNNYQNTVQVRFRSQRLGLGYRQYLTGHDYDGINSSRHPSISARNWFQESPWILTSAAFWTLVKIAYGLGMQLSDRLFAQQAQGPGFDPPVL